MIRLRYRWVMLSFKYTYKVNPFCVVGNVEDQSLCALRLPFLGGLYTSKKGLLDFFPHALAALLQVRCGCLLFCDCRNYNLKSGE